MIKNILNTNIILIILIIGVLTLVISLVPLIKQNSECQLNPLVYGAKAIEKETGPLLCTCKFEDERLDDIIFDSEEMVAKEKDRGQFIPQFNFTPNGN